MAKPSRTAQRRRKRLSDGSIPDPLGLGAPDLAVSGERRELKVGSRRIRTDGYIAVKTDEGVEKEHRLVMERELGRPLKPNESARHRNRDTLDNRPENLVLYKGNRPVDMKTAMKPPPPKTRRRRRYAIVPVPRGVEILDASSPKEAEGLATTKGIAVAASRVSA
jgi:hypothetical protein